MSFLISTTAFSFPQFNCYLFTSRRYASRTSTMTNPVLTKNHNPSRFRSSVGAIVFNNQGDLLCGKRKDLPFWQFPQGGMHPEEDPVTAALREINEEIGLSSDKLQIVPQPLIPSERFTYHLNIFKDGREYAGQEQRYILFQWDGHLSQCNLDPGLEPPEFCEVAWLTWDELISKCVPSRTFIYARLRNSMKPLIKGYIEKSNSKTPYVFKGNLEGRENGILNIVSRTNKDILRNNSEKGKEKEVIVNTLMCLRGIWKGEKMGY